MSSRSLDPDLVQRDVGRRIAELRADRGLTQEGLASDADVSWKYLQQVEAGRENLTLQSLVRFANLLRVPMTELFQRPKSRKRRPGRPAKPAGETKDG